MAPPPDDTVYDDDGKFSLLLSVCTVSLINVADAEFSQKNDDK